MGEVEQLLGRDEPLHRMRDVLARAAAGLRSVVLVTGQAGIGKSSLVRAAAAGVDLVGWGTCVEDVAAPGYWPWTRALDAIAGRLGPARTAATAGEDAPLLAAIGRSFGDAATGDASERQRLLLMDAVNAWLGRVAAEGGPAVVVLDDLQWADESSLALLEFVARDPAPAAVCIVGCYRHDELPPASRDRLARLAMSATSVDLAGLDRDAVAGLVASVAGSLGADEVDDMYRRAGGHPVFTRELALLAASGDHHRIPRAVQDAIHHRFRLLPDATRRALEVAALAGNAVSAGVVAAAGDLPVATVHDALVMADKAGIVVLDPDGRAGFAHDLYRETIAASVPSEARVALHQRIGAALEERRTRGDDVSPAELARHFTAAIAVDGTARAARWALAAAASDREALAFRDAAAHLRRWRASVAAAPVAADDRELCDVLLAEADALARAGAVVDARGLIRLAHDIARRSGLADLLARAALAVSDLGARFAARRDDVVQELEQALDAVSGVDPVLEARVLATLARELQHSVVADRPRAGPLSERALELGRAGGDPPTLVSCLLARHDVLWTPGTGPARIDIAREIVATAARMGDDEHRAQGQLLLATALLEAGSAAFAPALESCLEILDGLGQPRHRYVAETRRAALLLLRGDLDGAEAAIEGAAEIGTRIREPDTGNVRMSQRLELARARRSPEELEAFAGAAVAHWTGAPVHAHSVAAGFLARAGDLDGARRHVAVVLDLGTWRADRSYLWSVFVRELGAAAVALDDRGLCRDLLADVAPLAPTCGVNGAVVAFAGSHAHTAWLLARHLGDEGASFRDEAGTVYRRLGAGGWLAELDAPSGAPAGGGARSMRRRGAAWDLAFDGGRASVPHVKGLADLAVLLGHPDRDVHVLELYGAVAVASSSSEVVDRRALDEYRRRLADLDEELDDAAAAHDIGRRERAEAERDALVAELGRVTTRRSGSRLFANYPAERARKAVAARIRDAIRRIEADLPALAAHLDAGVVTGLHCRYRSDGGRGWDVDAG
ncbi:MAG: ATP-binding protein [Actinomycetota bacterium]